MNENRIFETEGDGRSDMMMSGEQFAEKVIEI